MDPVDPFTPESLEDPYPLYATLREHAPVYRLPQTGIWLVTRHQDVVEAAEHPEIFSSHISAIVYAGQGTNPIVIPADPDAIGAVDVLATQDPPAHTVQRKLLNRSFVAAKTQALAPKIRSFVASRLDGEPDLDWVAEVADPLPVSIISTLLGLPDEDADRLRTWADAGVSLLSGVAPAERLAEAWQEMVAFLAYLRERLHRAAPDTVAGDVAAAVSRDEITDREGVSLLLQLVIAGSESTTSLIGSAAAILARDEAVQASLRDEPGRIGAFLEEALRLESPFRGHFRVTTQDTELGGASIPAGSRVMLMWASANRDPAAFDEPGRVRLDRAHPRAHVGFGSGIHFCIGAPLARMEASAAIETLLERTRRFRLAAPEVRHVPSVFVRRLAALPLLLEPS